MENRSVCYGLVCGVVALFTTATIGHTQSMTVSARAESVPMAPVSIDVVNAPLASVLETIARQAGLRRSWDPQVIQAAPRVTLRVRDVPIDEAFAKALVGTGLKAVVTGSVVNVVKSGTAVVAQGGISGKVIDAKTRQGLRGATITLNGTNTGTTSNDDGSFRITAIVPGTYTIYVRMLGYVKMTKAVTVQDGQTASIEIVLNPSVNALDQVVVTGTVVSTEMRAIPNAMTVITAKQIEERGITRIDQLFRGDVPGMFALNTGSGDLLDEVTMFSRGATAFLSSVAGAQNGTNPIKTYVDGVELADPKYLSQIDPSSIERIEILTGPQASTIYGSNAINGVMQIFTKRGASMAPQMTLSVLSGMIQNNQSTALAPNHQGDARITGVEGRLSYNVGGTVNYVGAWTSAKQTTRWSGDGGGRIDGGTVTADISYRRAMTVNQQRGQTSQGYYARVATGEFTPRSSAGRSAVRQSTLDGETVGLTLRYAPVSWWSHELVFGQDMSETQSADQRPANNTRADTALTFLSATNVRTSQRYATTIRVPVTPAFVTTMTVGADHWRTHSSSVRTSGSTLTGTLANPTVTRGAPGKNTGGFLQGQLGIHDAMFLTYGLRAEWSPGFGDDQRPNLAPRYGVAMTREMETLIGPVTAKVRFSYGRATRPPGEGLMQSVPMTDAVVISEYGPTDERLANTELGPEYQQGGEGGLELYMGNRASFIVTRYNQTVDGLIQSYGRVDSVRSLDRDPTIWDSEDADGYGYLRQSQYLNIGSIRNQGWELQGSMTLGPVVTQGTYSWTKSRVIGITPKYRAYFDALSSQFQVGGSTRGLPEHTWSFRTTYTQREAQLMLAIRGTGQRWVGNTDALYLIGYASDARLRSNLARFQMPSEYHTMGPPYTITDLNGIYRFSHRVEGILQISNLLNYYQNDAYADLATIGRQSKAGFRVRL